MAESTASSAASWMPSMWSAIEATNTEHDIKRKEKAAKKALVMLLDQSDQTQEVNLMPSLLKGTLSELNQEQEKRKVSKAKKKESKKKKKEQEEMLEYGGGLSALFGMYSSVSGNGDSSGTGSLTSGSSSSGASTAVRSPGLSSSKATDSSSISSNISYVADFDSESDVDEATTANTSARVVAGQLQEQRTAHVANQDQSPAASLSSISTTATPTNTTPASTSPLTLPSPAATAPAPISPIPTKESILLQIVQIKQQQKQDEDAFIEASRTIMATQPQLQIQLAAMHQQKSRKLIAQELALLQQLQTLQQVTATGATASIADVTTAPNATVALQLSNKRRQQQQQQLQLLQQQQEQALALNQLAANGITANANVLANAQLAHVRPPKRQRTTATQQLQQAFFNNCPSMSEQPQNIMEYTLPLTLPLMFRVGAFTTFAQLWCLVIVVGHTLETVFTNFGPNTRKLRLSDTSAKIEPLVHHLIDCGWLHTFISCMFLYPAWFSTDTTLLYWMAVGLVQTLPIYLSVSFKSHYLNGQVKGEVDMKKSQLIELRLMDCFTYYGVSTLCFVLFRRANCFAWLGNGKTLLYLGVLLFNVAPLYLTWAYHKQYETVKKEKSTTCIKTGRIVKYKDEKVEQHEMQLEMPQRLPVLVEEEEIVAEECEKATKNDNEKNVQEHPYPPVLKETERKKSKSFFGRLFRRKRINKSKKEKKKRKMKKLKKSW